LGAAGAGMDFEIAVIAVGLAREKAFKLAPACVIAQFLERGFSLRDNLAVAFALAELDQLQRLIDLALDPPIAPDRPLQLGPFAQGFLRLGSVVPQLRFFGLADQLFEAGVCDIPVKDAPPASPPTP